MNPASAIAADGGPAVAEAAAAWTFRWRVELEAEVRFAWLGDRLARSGAADQLVALARRAAGDERRHAERCAAVAASLGHPVEGPPPPPPEVAPAGLAPGEALTYELVAACCVAETLSVAVLTALLAEVRAPALRAVLRELAADEVGHARLGWAYLASLEPVAATAFLGPLLPAMLRASADEALFASAAPDRQDPTLLQLGVLRHGERRRVFRRTLESVVFPGLDAAGVDTAAGRAWLASTALVQAT